MILFPQRYLCLDMIPSLWKGSPPKFEEEGIRAGGGGRLSVLDHICTSYVAS